MKRFLFAGEAYVSSKPTGNSCIVPAIARQSGLTTWAIAVLLALIGLFTQVAQADVAAPAKPTSRAVFSTEAVHKPSFPLQQQQHVLTGTVVDQDGQPLEGVTVAVRGTGVSTSTDSRGQFILSTATSNGTLLISLLGHQSITQRFDAENPGPFHFTLIPVDSRLEEVEVSTGYERLPRERATGSFVFIDSALLNRSVSTDIISRLKGVTPSLLFDERAGGEPKLSIRGRSTIFANADPLVVVDNFPYEGNINNINPNDVESVTILRDAAAASIWGVRAGNGVIVITTKQGKAGHPLQVSFNGNVTVGAKPDLWYEPRISSADLVELEEFLYENGHFQDALVNSVSHPPISPAVEVMSNPTLSQDEKQNLLAKLKKNDVRHDLNRYFYQPTVNQQYASNLSGSSPRHQYFLFAGHDRNRRETVGNHYERSSISA